MHETSSVMVDPVTRAISCSHQGAPTQSDASKVVAKGLGLTKGFIGQKNSFSVDCSKAGLCDCDLHCLLQFHQEISLGQKLECVYGIIFWDT